MLRTHKEIVEIISGIEKGFPVNTIVYNDLQIWPYLRVQLTYFLFNGPFSRCSEGFAGNKSMRYWFSYFRAAWIKINTLRRKLNDLGKNAESLNADFLFIANENDKLERIDSATYYPFADSLGDYIAQKGKYNIIKNSVNGVFNDPHNYYIDHIVARARMKFELRKFVFRKYENSNIPKYAALLEFLSKQKIAFNRSEQEMVELLEFIFSMQKEFEHLFTKVHAKVVFYTVYYDEYIFAATLACKKLGIRSVEMQHGQQGEYSPFDSHFFALPESGYKLLPEYFWTWGKKSTLRKMMFMNNKFHKVIVGGNTWMSLWLNTMRFRALSFSLPESVTGDQRIKVLVALQPVDDCLPDFLLETIASTRVEIFWMVRMHPSMKKYKEEVKMKLSSIDNVELEYSTSLPLYSLFQNVDFVVTHWSTVAYEALNFGVHPVITHAVGKDLMGDYIEQGVFSYATTSSALRSILRTSKDSLLKKEKDKFIEADESVIYACIDKIIA